MNIEVTEAISLSFSQRRSGLFLWRCEPQELIKNNSLICILLLELSRNFTSISYKNMFEISSIWKSVSKQNGVHYYVNIFEKQAHNIKTNT